MAERSDRTHRGLERYRGLKPKVNVPEDGADDSTGAAGASGAAAAGGTGAPNKEVVGAGRGAVRDTGATGATTGFWTAVSSAEVISRPKSMYATRNS